MQYLQKKHPSQHHSAPGMTENLSIFIIYLWTVTTFSWLGHRFETAPSFTPQTRVNEGKVILQTRTWPKIRTRTCSAAALWPCTSHIWPLTSPRPRRSINLQTSPWSEPLRAHTSSPTPLPPQQGHDWMHASSIRRYCFLRSHLLQHSFFIRFLKQVSPSIEREWLPSALTRRSGLSKASSVSSSQKKKKKDPQTIWPYTIIQLF